MNLQKKKKKKKTLESSFALFAMWGHSKKMFLEDTSRNQEAGPHQTPKLLAPWFWTSSLQKYGK